MELQFKRHQNELRQAFDQIDPSASGACVCPASANPFLSLSAMYAASGAVSMKSMHQYIADAFGLNPQVQCRSGVVDAVSHRFHVSLSARCLCLIYSARILRCVHLCPYLCVHVMRISVIASILIHAGRSGRHGPQPKWQYRV